MQFKITIMGNQPLLMHNSRLANPMDPITRALKVVSSKRKKTDDDHFEMSRLEFLGSLYFDKELGPYIPGENVQRCLTEAARFQNLGKKVERGLFITTSVNPLAYKGPRDETGLWEDENFRHFAIVRVGTSRVSRTRVQFQKWGLEAQGRLDESQLSWDQLQEIGRNAGLYVGLGDWRPRFGLFDVELSKEKS